MLWSCLSVCLVPCGSIEFVKVLQSLFPVLFGQLALVGVSDLNELRDSLQGVLNDRCVGMTNSDEAIAGVSRRLSCTNTWPASFPQQIAKLALNVVDSIDSFHDARATVAQENCANGVL